MPRYKIVFHPTRDDLDPQVIDLDKPDGQAEFEFALGRGWLEAREKIEAEQDAPGVAAALGVGNVFSMGQMDRMAAAGQGLYQGAKKAVGFDLDGDGMTYDQRLAQYQADIKERRQQNPGGYQVGVVGAGLAELATGGAGLLAKRAAKKTAMRTSAGLADSSISAVRMADDPAGAAARRMAQGMPIRPKPVSMPVPQGVGREMAKGMGVPVLQTRSEMARAAINSLPGNVNVSPWVVGAAGGASAATGGAPPGEYFTPEQGVRGAGGAILGGVLSAGGPTTIAANAARASAKTAAGAAGKLGKAVGNIPFKAAMTMRSQLSGLPVVGPAFEKAGKVGLAIHAAKDAQRRGLFQDLADAARQPGTTPGLWTKLKAGFEGWNKMSKEDFSVATVEMLREFERRASEQDKKVLEKVIEKNKLLSEEDLYGDSDEEFTKKAVDDIIKSGQLKRQRDDSVSEYERLLREAKEKPKRGPKPSYRLREPR